MVTFTGRLKLAKPAPVGEVVDIAQFNQNMDRIDEYINSFTCTSTTRPSSPFPGMVIRETDTGFLYVRMGNRWQWLLGSKRATGGNGGALTTDMTASPNGAFVILDPGWYQFSHFVHITASVSGNFTWQSALGQRNAVPNTGTLTEVGRRTVVSGTFSGGTATHTHMLTQVAEVTGSQPQAVYVRAQTSATGGTQNFGPIELQVQPATTPA